MLRHGTGRLLAGVRALCLQPLQPAVLRAAPARVAATRSLFTATPVRLASDADTKRKKRVPSAAETAAVESSSGDSEQELRLQDIILPRKRREDPADGSDPAAIRLDDPQYLNQFVRLGKASFDDRFNVLKYPKGIDDFFHITESNALLCRSETQDLIRFVQQNPDSPLRVLLDGKRGRGKSVLMLQLVRQCLVDGWIVLYIPRLQRFTLPELQTVLVQQKGKPNVYMHPEMCRLVLAQLQALNGDKLAEVTLRQPVSILSQEFAAGTPVTEVIDALENADLLVESTVPCDVYDRVIDALVNHTASPVLFAMDQVNALYSPTGYRDMDSSPLFVKSMPDLYRLREVMSGVVKLKRGAVIGASSFRDPALQRLPPRLERSVHFIMMPSEFVQEEMSAFLQHWSATVIEREMGDREYGFSQEESPADDVIKNYHRLSLFTNRNPEKVVHLLSRM